MFSAASGVCRAFLPRHFHAGIAGQRFHGLGEAEIVEFHDEADGVAAGATAKAVKELAFRLDAE